jgi:hypothetical protein
MNDFLMKFKTSNGFIQRGFSDKKNSFFYSSFLLEKKESKNYSIHVI